MKRNGFSTDLHFFNQLRFFIWREQVWNVSCVENHVDVLHVGLLLDLLIVEEEDGLQSISTRLQHHLLYVVAPILEGIGPEK